MTTCAAGDVPDKVQVLHLLVKHNESRNPKSWRFPSGINLSKDEAISQLDQHRAQIAQFNPSERRKEFEALASQVSDCSSAKRGGDLGLFGRGQMQKPFEDASFSLQEMEICASFGCLKYLQGRDGA